MYSSPFHSLRGRLWHSIRQFPQQGLGPSKRCHSRGYARSSEHNSEGASGQLMEERSSTSSSSIPYAIPAALLGIVGLAAYVRYNDERRAILKGEGTNQGVTIKTGPTIGGPFSLINFDRQVFTEKNLLGNWVLLYFGYTSSPDVGPSELQKMAKALNILESKQNVKVLPIFVSIDPQRDSPSHLKAYLGEFDSRIMGLTGPVGSVRQMAQEYRIFFKKVDEEGNDYLVESSHNMYFMNPNMEIVRVFGVEYNAEQLAEAIMQELKRIAS